MINIERHIPVDELVSSLREVKLLNQEVRPYEDADIDLRTVSVESFRPTQLYVLSGAIERQRKLREELLPEGVDTLYLDGGIAIDNDGYRVAMIPPIIEEDPEHGPSLLDGTHRAMMAHRFGRKALNVLYIKGVHADYPIHSYPTEWENVIEYHATPEDVSLKRRYRTENPIALRRDLSSLNGSVIRKPGSAA
jgi:hypothetical protein